MSSADPDSLPIPGADPRLGELIAALGLDAGSRAYFEELRWPGGVACPRCSSDRIGYLASRHKYHCRDCAYQFRVTARTVLHDSHAPLSYWLVAVGLMLESERGYPALRLQKDLGGSFKTAWFVEHRIRSAMSRALAHSGLPAAGPGTPLDEDWAKMRRFAAGAYHRPSPNHVNAYWGEALWRRRCLDDEDAFRRTVEALLEAEPLQWDRLTHAGRSAALAETTPEPAGMGGED